VNIANSTHSDPKRTQEPLVSILVPSYNHEKYILECLDSIDNLDYPRLELLVSDDCSHDDTFRLADQWARDHTDRFERTLVVRQDKNLGITGNLQYLFDSAQGAYLVCIASDDMFVESAIGARVQMLETNPNIDAIFGNAQFISESGSLIQNEFIPKRNAKMLLKLSSRKLLAAQLILTFRAPGPILMIRKEAVCENGNLGRLPENMEVEDVYIYLRLAALGRLAFTDSVVAKYRRTTNGMTRNLSMGGQGALVEGYKMTRHLMKGFNRIVLDNRLSRYTLEWDKENASFYKVRAFILRSITAQLKAIMYITCVLLREPS